MREEQSREQVTARPLKETIRKLSEGAKKRNIHTTTYYAMILDKAAKFETKDGVMIVDKMILKDTYCDPEKVDERAKEHAERKFEEWRISEEEISLENYERRIREWSALSSMHVKITVNNESIIYDVNHGMDEQWSKFQCMMNIGILELMDKTIKDHQVRRLSWSITVSRPPI